MPDNAVTRRKKAVIGCIAGLSLALLQLIEAGESLISNPLSNESLATYLSFGCYAGLGALAAMFFNVPDLSRDARRRNALIAGLVAPSILLAAPIAVHADESDRGQSLDPGSAPRVLNEGDFDLSFKDAFAVAIGRPVERKDHLYVVGVARDKSTAFSTVRAIKRITGDRERVPAAKVMRLEDSEDYYVVLGDLQSYSDVLDTERSAKEVAFAAMEEDRERSAAKLLHGGVVVNGKALFRKGSNR